MKFLFTLCLLLQTTQAFHPSTGGVPQSRPFGHTAPLAAADTPTAPEAATTPLMDMPPTASTKQNLIDTAERLKEQYGLFLVDSTAKQELQAAVEELERLSEPPTLSDDLLGTWELVCTTATSKDGVDTSKVPFFDAGPLKQIRDSIRKSTNRYLTVQQVVKAATDDEDNSRTGSTIHRIDHVVQYQPPKELRDVLDNLPEQLTTVNINPLQVSESKLVLIHKATVESTSMPLKVTLGLTSVVLNVAGSSQFLDPTGKDVSSINLPGLGEFSNAGSFETTYMDDELRISRGKLGGVVDQLRVFVRPGRVEKDAILKDILESDVSVGKGVDAEADVDEFVDPEFTNDAPSDVEEI